MSSDTQNSYSDSTIEKALAAIKFDVDGLVPAIAQQHESGEVLMMAWMNAESISETLKSGQVCYFSRSRQKLCLIVKTLQMQ